MPNEALSKWVGEKTVWQGDIDWERVHPLSRVAAKFWLRSFVQEVRNKAAASMLSHKFTTPNELIIGMAFEQVEKEFGLDTNNDS